MIAIIALFVGYCIICAAAWPLDLPRYLLVLLGVALIANAGVMR